MHTDFLVIAIFPRLQCLSECKLQFMLLLIHIQAGLSWAGEAVPRVKTSRLPASALGAALGEGPDCDFGGLAGLAAAADGAAFIACGLATAAAGASSLQQHKGASPSERLII